MTGRKPLTVADVTDEHRYWLEQVGDRTVWWHPRLHPATKQTPAEGGFVRIVGDRTTPFAELSELITLWQLYRGGLIEPVKCPIDPDAAKRPRAVQVTAPGLSVLRGMERTQGK